MKLAVEMAVMEMDGEYSAVAVGEDASKFHGMLSLNETAADIVRLLGEETTAEEIVKALLKKYDESTAEEVAAIVSDFLEKLRKEGLLAE